MIETVFVCTNYRALNIDLHGPNEDVSHKYTCKEDYPSFEYQTGAETGSRYHTKNGEGAPKTAQAARHECVQPVFLPTNCQ